MNEAGAEGVLITGVYGSGKSSVAAELAFVLEGRGDPYALLDLDFLGWGGVPGSGRASEVRLSVSLDQIERRLASDVTSGRRDDLRAAASSLSAGEGAGLEDLTVGNDQAITAVAGQIMAWLGWDAQPR